MQPFIEEFVDRLDATPECRTLEVGAGSGIMTECLARRVKSLLATDFAPKMLEVLRERMEEAGIQNVEVEEMDGQNLSVEDDSFDRAASSFALMLFPDRAKGFSELRRVLRPGGRVMVSAWAGPDKFEGFALFLGAMKMAFPDMPPPPAPPPVFSLSDLGVFKAEMEAAGFQDVEVDYVSRVLELPDFESTWNMFTVGAPPVKMLFDKVGEAGKENVRQALAAIVEERFGGGPIRLTNAATVGCGVA
jgi:SAM-dependent methyltransferase